MFSLPPTGRAKIGDLMTVMFMTEAGRKTGDSNIDRLAAEYEDTYGMPLSDAQIERLDQLSDSPEFGNYAIDTSGFVSDAPFGSPQRIAELREFTSRLRAERDAKRAKLTLEAAGISPDQPVSRSPEVRPFPPQNDNAASRVIEALRRAPRRPPPLERLPVDDLLAAQQEYGSTASPYAELGRFLNRPVFDRGSLPQARDLALSRIGTGPADNSVRAPERPFAGLANMTIPIAELKEKLRRPGVQPGNAPLKTLSSRIRDLEGQISSPLPASPMPAAKSIQDQIAELRQQVPEGVDTERLRQQIVEQTAPTPGPQTGATLEQEMAAAEPVRQATGLAAEELTGDPDMDRMILAARDAQGVSTDIGQSGLSMDEFLAGSDALTAFRNLPENRAFRKNVRRGLRSLALGLVAAPFLAPAAAGISGALGGGSLTTALTKAGLRSGLSRLTAPDQEQVG